MQIQSLRWYSVGLTLEGMQQDRLIGPFVITFGFLMLATILILATYCRRPSVVTDIVRLTVAPCASQVVGSNCESHCESSVLVCTPSESTRTVLGWSGQSHDRVVVIHP